MRTLTDARQAALGRTWRRVVSWVLREPAVSSDRKEHGGQEQQIADSPPPDHAQRSARRFRNRAAKRAGDEDHLTHLGTRSPDSLRDKGEWLSPALRAKARCDMPSRSRAPSIRAPDEMIVAVMLNHSPCS